MTTMTMPATVERTQADRGREVGHLMPLLLAVALLAVTAIAAVLISGPMH